MSNFDKMRVMRFFVLCVLAGVPALTCFGGAEPVVDARTTTIHGKLIQHDNQKAVMETAGHKLITLEGDESTSHVLHDKRLSGAELETRGHFQAPDRFEIDPFHTRALHVMKNGKRLSRSPRSKDN